MTFAHPSTRSLKALLVLSSVAFTIALSGSAQALPCEDCNQDGPSNSEGPSVWLTTP